MSSAGGSRHPNGKRDKELALAGRVAWSFLMEPDMAASLQLIEVPGSAAESDRGRALLTRAVAGRYRVLRMVSRGGMGAVYLAFEHGLERHVALKLLDPARCRDEETRGRFRREARVMAQLSHPIIVPVHAWGDADGACWYAMPFLEGGSLAARLAARSRLDIEETREILAHLADALAFAHGRGVIHRDLKAENVLFDGSGRPMLTDFGIATVTTSDHSRSEAHKGMGTPHYMAPEHLLGRLEADHRGDLYALGVLGFRMLTGRFPFEGTAEAIAAQHVSRDAPTVRAWRADVPAALADAVDCCLAKRPGARWPDGASLCAALRAPAPARRFGLGRFRLLML